MYLSLLSISLTLRVTDV
jgi:hypothetical protein